MKQEIMKKLLNGEELTTDEIRFINRTCKEEGSSTTTTSAPPIDCSKENVMDACGITKEIFEEFNARIERELKSPVTCISDVILMYDKLMEENEIYKRIILLRLVKYQTSPMSLLLRSLI